MSDRKAFSHDRVPTGKEEWLTPPEIVCAFGPFDLDPCAPVNRPWPTAAHHYTEEHDGLSRPWAGRVWMNPPYGPKTGAWLKRLAEHGNGIALVFARTETRAFFDYVWPAAHGVLFIRGRLKFHHVDGTQAAAAGAPSCLIAYGEENELALRDSLRWRAAGISGFYTEAGGSMI
jgi:hypothetical protein